MKKNRLVELIIGIFNIMFGIGFGIMFAIFNLTIISVVCIFIVALGCYLVIGADRVLEFRTANLHEMTSEGVVHSKDKSVHINAYQDSIYSKNEYLIRVKTPIGFYDTYDKNAYMTYKEDDKIKILVKTRYNRKGKAFRQETIILGLLSQLYN